MYELDDFVRTKLELMNSSSFLLQWGANRFKWCGVDQRNVLEEETRPSRVDLPLLRQ
jgi:hypothetical protein